MMSRAPRLGAALAGGLTLFLLQPGCVPPTAKDPPIVSIEVFGNAEVRVGSSITLYTHRTDQYGNGVSSGTVTWSSSNPAVATVGAQTGLVTGVTVGTVEISASSGGVTGKKTIEVKASNNPVSSVTVSGPASIKTYEQGTFTAVLRDFNGNEVFRPVAWTSSDPSKATVVPASGVVTAVSEGSVTITGTSEGRQGTAQLTITPPAVNEVFLSGTTTVLVGFTTRLEATLKDALFLTLTGRPVTWSSSDPSKATVNDGLVLGVAPGTATITATSEGKSGSVLVTVSTTTAVLRLSGRVIDGSNNTGLSNAFISLKRLDGTNLVGSAITEADGSFTTSSFNSQPDGVMVEATRTGYVTGRIRITSGLSGDPASIETIPLVPVSAQKGAISGVVRNARTGLPIPGASLALYDNVAAAPLAPATADGAGVYTFSNLNAGTYRVSATAPGYQLLDRIGIAVGNGGVTSGQDLILAPTGTTDIRIVLTWGAEPQDLDSHLTGPDGSLRFHVYFANTGHFNSPPFAGLDLDDTFSYGPETVSITQMSSGNYRYSVHDFTNRNSASSTALGNSGAVVRVYNSTGLILTKAVPQGAGNLWTVFEMTGTLTGVNFNIRNELSFASTPSTIPAPPAVAASGGHGLTRSGETDAEAIARAVGRQTRKARGRN